MTDVVSSLIVSGGLRIAGLPPDRNHPYGHGKAESLSALIVSVALLATAGGIALESVQEIQSTASHEAPKLYTLAVLAVVIVIKEWLFRSHRRGGDEIGSAALQADAWHHRCDAIASTAAAVGITIAIIGGPRFYVADSWAALAVCLVIAATGVHLLWRNLQDVMDVAAPPEIEARIRAVAAAVPEVAAVEKCRVRRSGLSLLVDIHIEVDGELSVRHGHAIAHDVKQALLDGQLSILDVAIHVEPAGGV
jgi:cation diffusion facilitator family transporter